MESLLDRILTRFRGLRGKEVSLKYADNNDWTELPADDLDSFIDMIETAKDSARENLKVIELKICELAQTPQETASHKRLRTSPSPKSGSVHVAKKPKHLMACYEAQVLRIILHVNRRRKLRTLTLIHPVVNPNIHELTYCNKLGSFRTAQFKRFWFS